MAAIVLQRTNGVLLKVDNDGTLEFLQEYPDSVNSTTYLRRVSETHDGYFLSGGVFRPDFYTDVFIRRTDKQGQNQWVTYYGTTDYTDWQDDNILLNDSTLLCSMSSRYKYISPYTEIPKIVLFDTSGQPRSVTEGPAGLQGYGQVIPTQDGGFIFASGIYRGLDNNGTMIFQPLLGKLNADFAIEWADSVGPSTEVDNFFWDLQPLPDGNYIAAGQWHLREPVFDHSYWIGWLYKFAPDGTPIWERTDYAPGAGVGDTHYFAGAGALSSGSVVAAGGVRVGNDDYGWLLKVSAEGCVDTLDCAVVSTPVVPTKPGGRVLVYPNPTSDGVFFESNKWPVSTATVANVDGQVVLSRTYDTPTATGSFDTRSLPSGMYFASFRLADQTTVQQKILVQH
jgi:hypothetical protein